MALQNLLATVWNLNADSCIGVEVPVTTNPLVNTYGFRSVGFSGPVIGAGARVGSYGIDVNNDAARNDCEVLACLQAKRVSVASTHYAGAMCRGSGATSAAASLYELIVQEDLVPSKGLQFDGVAANLAIASHTIAGGGEITVEAIINADTSLSSGGIYEKTVGGSVNTSFLLFIESGVLKFRIKRNSDGTLISAQYTIPPGWLGVEHHVAGVFDTGTGNVSLYVDGASVGTPGSAGAGEVFSGGAGVAYVGKLATAGFQFKGTIREVRVWSTARSQLDIIANKSIYVSGSEAGCVSYWRLDDNGINGGFAVERHAFLTSTLTSSPTWVADPTGIFVSLRKVITGTVTTLDRVPVSLASAGVDEDIYLRLRANGTTIQSKVWRVADVVEPTAWGIQTVDSSVSGAGYCGLVCEVVTANNASYRLPGCLAFGTSGESAPTPRTNPQIRDYFNDTSNPQVTLIELGVLGTTNRGAANDSVLLVSTHKYVTTASETPKNQSYMPVILDIPKYKVSAPEPGSGGSRATQSYGDLTLKNEAGKLDRFLRWNWNGRSYDEFRGGPGWRRWDFVRTKSLTVSECYRPAPDVVGFRLRDNSAKLNRKLQLQQVGGVLATATQPRPVGLGTLFNIEPVPIDDTTFRYKFHDETLGISVAATGITAVRDAGIGVSFTDRGWGEFTLNATPAGRVTCDVTVDRSNPNAWLTPEDIKPGLVSASVVEAAAPACDGRPVLQAMVPNTTNTGHYSVINYAKAAVAEAWTIEVDVTAFPNGRFRLSFTETAGANTAVVDIDLNAPPSVLSGIDNPAYSTSGATPFSGLSFTYIKNPSGGIRATFRATTPALAGITAYVQARDPVSGSTNWAGDGLANGTSNICFGRVQLYRGSAPPSYSNETNEQVMAGFGHGILMQCLAEHRGGLNVGGCYVGSRNGSLALFDPSACGRYYKDDINILDALDEVAYSGNGTWTFSTLGQVIAGQWKVPAPPYDHVLTKNLLDDEPKLVKVFLPSEVEQLGFKKNWAVQKGADLAGGVTLANRALFGLDAQYSSSTVSEPQGSLDKASLNVMRRKPKNRITLRALSADAATESARWGALMNRACALVSFPTRVNAVLPGYDMYQSLHLTYDRLGFDLGVPGIIVGIEQGDNGGVVLTIFCQLEGLWPTTTAADKYIAVEDFT